MSIPKVARLGSALMQYANSANPTKSSSMMDFFLNNNEVLAALASKLLWQPSTAYATGKLVMSSTMPIGLVAVVTSEGLSGTTEPTWGTIGATVPDNTVSYVMVKILTTADLATLAEARAGTETLKAVTPAGLKSVSDTKADKTEIVDLARETATAITTLDTNKVDKISGKQLSTEDYTTDEKDKLEGISEKAEVNPKFATDAEVTAGTSTDTIVSPSTMHTAMTENFVVEDGQLKVIYEEE